MKTKALTLTLVLALLLMLLMVASFPCIKAATETPPRIQWSKTYDTGGASSIIQTQDGGFMIAGANRTRLPTVYTMYNYTTLLVKTNNSGEVEWTKTFPGTNGLGWIMQTTDSGYLLLGRSAYSGWLLKTDSQGNLEWNRTVDLQQNGLQQIMGFTVAKDGSYVIAGYAENPES